MKSYRTGDDVHDKTERTGAGPGEITTPAQVSRYSAMRVPRRHSASSDV
jgi:hypothetical protein